MLRKATSVKMLKVAPTLSQKELALKLKQVVELSQRHQKVKVVMVIKVAMREEGLSKLEWIKSELMNSCYLEEEIAARQPDEDEEEEVDEKRKGRRTEGYGFVVRARDGVSLKQKEAEKSVPPQEAITQFLSKYYRQDDADMMDLKSAGMFGMDGEEEIIARETDSMPESAQREEGRDREELVWREAKARVLNERLKVLLSLYQ